MIGPGLPPLMSRPVRDRPRERLASLGPAALSDAELVAILLGSGTRGRPATELAAVLLAELGGVAGIANADVDELARHSGIGAAKASTLVAAFALSSRISLVHAPVVASSADIAAAAISRIGSVRTEHVLLLILDAAHRLRKSAIVATGSAISCMVPVREILALALRHDAVAIALAHNHPGGTVIPSTEDREATQRLRRATREVGIRFLDHVIVSGDDWASITAPDVK
ncbi:RadC family protein [Gordonia sp. NPDC003422]